MKTQLTILMLFLTTACFAQKNVEKIIGDWTACSRLYNLENIDSIIFNKRIVKCSDTIVNWGREDTLYNTDFIAWKLEKNQDENKFRYRIFRNCSNCVSVSMGCNWSNGIWVLDKEEKILIISDDKQEQYLFKIIELTDTKLKIKKVNR